MFLTRWLCIAEQQVHIWTEEAVGSGCRARRRRALTHCQSFPVQRLEVHFVGQLCNQNATTSSVISSIKIRYSSVSPSLSGTLVYVYTANRSRTSLDQWENTVNSFNTVLTSSTTEEPELSVICSKDAAANFPQLVQVQSVIPSGVLQQHHPLCRTNHQARLLNIKRLKTCAIKYPVWHVCWL